MQAHRRRHVRAGTVPRALGVLLQGHAGHHIRRGRGVVRGAAGGEQADARQHAVARGLKGDASVGLCEQERFAGGEGRRRHRG